MKKVTGLIYNCALFVATLFFISCNPSKRVSNNYLYFENNADGFGNVSFIPPKIQTNDLLSIQVFIATLKQKEEAEIFSLTGSDPREGKGYLVASDSTIQMSLLNKIKAVGYTCEELSRLLEARLSEYIPKASVDVRFLEFKINVLGEVNSPGTYNFKTGKASVIDAISLAGDLTEYGKRDRIIVVREENGKRTSYVLDIRSTEIFLSPAFQLRQNDIVYVEAVGNKLKNLDVNPKAQKNIQLGLALASFAALVANLIVTFR